MKLIGAALAGLLLVSSCTRLTAESYEKLRVGMAYEDVRGLLGAPDRCSDLLGVKTCVWGDERRSITVNFVGGKALVFASENLR